MDVSIGIRKRGCNKKSALGTHSDRDGRYREFGRVVTVLGPEAGGESPIVKTLGCDDPKATRLLRGICVAWLRLVRGETVVRWSARLWAWELHSWDASESPPRRIEACV